MGEGAGWIGMPQVRGGKGLRAGWLLPCWRRRCSRSSSRPFSSVSLTAGRRPRPWSTSHCARHGSPVSLSRPPSSRTWWSTSVAAGRCTPMVAGNPGPSRRAVSIADPALRSAAASERGTVATPQSAAKEVSVRRRSALPTALIKRWAAVSGPTPNAARRPGLLSVAAVSRGQTGR